METKKKPTKKTAISAKKTSPIRKPRVTKQSRRIDFQKYFLGIKANIQKNRALYSRYLIITGVVVLVGLFAFWKKDWFVVAVVNNQPITSVELYQNMKSKYGQEILNQLIRDKIITQEAAKKGIVISQADIDKKISEFETQVGGKDQLKAALTSNNISESDFRNNVKTQLMVEKLLEKDIQVSDKEIDDYIAKNPTDPNVASANTKDQKVRDKIRSQLRSNKLNDKFQSWYSDLEKKSSITKFI